MQIDLENEYATARAGSPSNATEKFPTSGNWSDMDRAFDNLANRPPKIPTGIGALDTILKGGSAAGDFIGVGAPAGSGKTILLLTLLANAARAGAIPIYLSAELDEGEVVSRLLSRIMLEAYIERHGAKALHAPAVSFDDLVNRLDLQGSGKGWADDLATARETARDQLGDAIIKRLPDAATDIWVRKSITEVRAANPDRQIIVFVDPLQRLMVGQRDDGPNTAADGRQPESHDRYQIISSTLKQTATDQQVAIWFASDIAGGVSRQLRNGEDENMIWYAAPGPIGNAITAGFSLTTGHSFMDGVSEETGPPAGKKNKPADTGTRLPGAGLPWAGMTPGVGSCAITAEEVAAGGPPEQTLKHQLGETMSVLRTTKLRSGRPMRAALLSVPGASVLYDPPTERDADGPDHADGSQIY
ncbi:MAG: DnaB-like helicase C-terminal domain-containing protein [Candidatus Binatia bacterium]|nr:DnaB-like helicase C-terminal domain-containing protein [Candidatus Binatia bacterium]MDG2010706.1 DnaB-like helicase C-terminal domain-containing protein [Candidatus Binatia bacterium]